MTGLLSVSNTLIIWPQSIRHPTVKEIATNGIAHLKSNDSNLQAGPVRNRPDWREATKSNDDSQSCTAKSPTYATEPKSTTRRQTFSCSQRTLGVAERKLAHLFRRRAIIFIVYVMVTNLDMSGMESRRLARSKMVGKRLKANADGEEAGTRIRKLIRTRSFFCSYADRSSLMFHLQFFLLLQSFASEHLTRRTACAHFSRARMHLHTHLHARGSRAGEGSS